MTRAPIAPSRAPLVDLAADRRGLPSLTGLRWVAAAVVFAFHVRNANFMEGPAQDALSRVFGVGAVGVSLFFILSGFVLTWADRPGLAPRSFWWRRFARIYPLHVVGVALAVVLGHTIARGMIFVDDPVAVLANLTLVNTWSVEWNQAGNLVSWTLGVEAFFYLLFPFLVPVARSLSPRALWIALVVVIGLVVILPVASPAFPSWLDYHTSPALRLPEFLLGIVVARLARSGAWRGPGLALSLALTVVGYVAARSAPEPLDLAACTIVGFACLIPALALRDVAGRGSPLAARWSMWLGEISFAFYLVHLLVIQSVGGLWPGREPHLGTIPGLLLILGVLALSVLIAWLLHVGVERPLQRALTAPRRAR